MSGTIPAPLPPARRNRASVPFRHAPEPALRLNFHRPRGGLRGHRDLLAGLTGLHHYWQPIRARAGLPEVRIHDLRHSYASRALALGESLYTIGKLLGHSRVSTTARYAHLMRDAEKAAASRVGESIGVHITNGRVERRW